MSFIPTSRISKILGSLALAFLISAVVSVSLIKIPAGHRGAIFRFGTLSPSILMPGLHLTAPWPIDQVATIPVESVQQLRLTGTSGYDSFAPEFLTGDTNLLNLAIQIDYRVSDVLECARTGLTLVDNQLNVVAESTLVEALAQASVSDVLGPGREALNIVLRDRIQTEADRLALGTQIISIVWLEISPPREVKTDFETTQAAVNEAAKLVAEATSQAEVERLQIKSMADSIQSQAEADAVSLKSDATSEAIRFQALLKQARRTGLLPTARKLWLDRVSQIIPTLKGRVLIGSDQPIDLTIIKNSSQPSPDAADTLKNNQPRPKSVP